MTLRDVRLKEWFKIDGDDTAQYQLLRVESESPIGHALKCTERDPEGVEVAVVLFCKVSLLEEISR